MSFEIVNEDGTSMDDFPKNPLAEKWKRLYPPTPMPQYSQVCDGYSCAFCGSALEETIGKFLKRIKRFGLDIRSSLKSTIEFTIRAYINLKKTTIMRRTK